MRYVTEMVVFLAIQMYIPIHIGRQTFKIT